MNYIGNISEMNISPIAGYNNFIKNNASFEIDESSDFDNILAQQSNALQQSQQQLRGGIEINSNADTFFIEPTSASASAGASGDFMKNIGNAFGNGLDSVNQKAVASERAQEALAMGEDVSVHDVMIASEKANLSMQMAIQLRNKLITAYNEIKDVKV